MPRRPLPRSGYLHLASDTLHLTAASAWIGGLCALALLLRAPAHHHDWASLELDVGRFSTLAIASVATLILSGSSTDGSSSVRATDWLRPVMGSS